MEPKKILIIDDTKDLADTLAEVVSFKGYQSIVATNGADGIETALREHPDLILLDIRMPDIDGFEVLRRIRKDEWGKTAKIVFLTASVSYDEVPTDLNVDKSDFLLKTQWGMGNITKKIEEKLAEAS